MSADEGQSPGTYDAKMIDDLRSWRESIAARFPDGAPRKETPLTWEEIDALLRAADERDALRREAAAEPLPRPIVTLFGVALPFYRDVETEKDAAVEEDERVIAWDAIAAHPFFRSCFGTEGTLLDAMTAKLDRAKCGCLPFDHEHPSANEVTVEIRAEIPDEIRARAAEPPALRWQCCAHCGDAKHGAHFIPCALCGQGAPA